MPVATRVLGALTTAYSVSIIVAPRLLAKPCGLATAAGEVTADVRTLVGGIGARDAAIGVAMMLAPPGRPLQVALAASGLRHRRRGRLRNTPARQERTQEGRSGRRRVGRVVRRVRTVRLTTR
ncbi:hypothetical protein GCM10029964_052040 [Kibdelosporangium lantanae]